MGDSGRLWENCHRPPAIARYHFGRGRTAAAGWILMNLSSRSRVTPRAMIGGAAALGAVILGTATQAGKTKGMDRAVRRRVKPKRHPRVVKLAKGISDFASPDVHPLVALVASVCVSAARGRPSVAPLIASASASGID